MNIPELQAHLRQFAADRDWQPLHTPKNLAMALMVEAAELVEIFQWLTPEQSRRAHRDAALKPRIDDELADVLLYLLQLADHMACDLPAAVAGKLLKNARKHPPLRAQLTRPALALPAPGQPTPGPADPGLHVLLDFENVQPDADELRVLVPGLTHLWLFHGPHQKDLAQRFAGFGAGLSLVPISQSGKNALDFHLSFYAGYIVARYPQAAIVVVANDKGYAPMLRHAEGLGFDVRQVGHARVAAAKRAAARRKAAAPAPAPVLAPAPVPAPQAMAALPAAAASRRPAARKAAARSPAVPQAAARAPTEPAAHKPARAPAARSAAVKAAPAPAPAPAVAQAPPALKMVQILARRAGAGHAPAAAAAPDPGDAASMGSASPKAAAAQQSKPVKPAAAPGAAATPRKLLASLRKMGDSLPTKQGRLLSILKSLLGAQASAADALAALARLVSAGQVVVAPGGAVSYRL